jgi:hypothetical protein
VGADVKLVKPNRTRFQWCAHCNHRRRNSEVRVLQYWYWLQSTAVPIGNEEVFIITSFNFPTFWSSEFGLGFTYSSRFQMFRSFLRHLLSSTQRSNIVYYIIYIYSYSKCNQGLDDACALRTLYLLPQTTFTMVRLLTVLLVLLSQLSTSWGFHSVVGLQRYSLRLHAEDVPWESAFPDAQVLTIQMQEHRPLGCTVEESLADSDLKPVFVSKVRSSFFEV